MHKTIEPSILYFGTPVILISTLNPDSSANVAPFSSVFWLGWRCILGISSSSMTAHNLLRTGECVINMPAVGQVGLVNRLALTTGMSPVPERKKRWGYRYEKDKFGIAGVTPEASQTVAAPRVSECPVQLEAVVERSYGLAEEDPAQRGNLLCVETRIQRVHVEASLLRDDAENKVDPDKWRPLLMSFQHFYGLGPQVHASTLATVPESAYRTPDVTRMREKKF